MAFQIDMSPLERASQGVGRGLVNVGNTIADAMQNRQQQQAQGDIDAFMAQSLSGDPVALKELMVRDPQRAQYVAQQLQQGIDKEQGEVDRFQGERALATADIIGKMHLAKTDAERTLIFNAAVDDPRYDIDEEDRPFFNDAEQRKAVFSKLMISNQDADQAKMSIDSVFGDKTKFSQGTGKMSGYVFNPDSGEFTVNQELKDKIDEAKVTGELDAKTRQAINKDFTNLTKETKLIRNTAQDLDDLSKMVDKDGNISGPSSIAMVFKFMKALDPTSVVRESEFKVAENSSGVPENLSNMYNKLWNGGKLGPKQVKEFITTAKRLANSATTSSSTEIDNYLTTFEDTLTPGFKKSIRGRIPKLFDIPDQVIDDTENTTVIMTHPTKGDITEAMIQSTMTANGMTREQVITKLGEK